MSWSPDDQAAEKKQFDTFMDEFGKTFGGWYNGIQAGSPAQGQAATEEVLRQWRKHVEELRARSEQMLAAGEQMDTLQALAREVADERATLKDLRGEAGTRAGQAGSVNPKVKASPYVNILGLQRTFRQSTRDVLLGLSIAFGVLAIGTLGYLVYQIAASRQIQKPSFVPSSGGVGIQVGSGRRSYK
jgi:hypothetical protein